MGGRGFTIRDQLARVGVNLNIPPFLESSSQLSPGDVTLGHNIP